MIKKKKPEVLNKDLLLLKIETALNIHKKQAKKHKNMYRYLWMTSAIISLLIAIFSAFELSFEIYKYTIQTKHLAIILAIILPFITGITVLRSPEKLWIFEIDTRNQLADLYAEVELQIDRNSDFNRNPYEKKYLKLMANANKKWVAIKEKSG